MDQERERIQADLRGLLEGEVRCDDLFLQLYSSDASIYEIKPLGVVRPKGAADVAAVVQYAAENDIPLHARGAGTGLAGESLGPGLVVDFSHSMRRILRVDDETVRVQPGVVHAQLNRHLSRYGRLFGPDPATSAVTTMGSVLALDGAGSHWPVYGSARSRVESMQVVLSDGTIIEAGKRSLTAPIQTTPDDSDQPADRLHAMVVRLVDLLRREAATIDKHQPASLVNRCGYHLHDVLRDDEIDLAKLLVGSEGTLAMITEATVRTDPLPMHRGVALLFFERLDAAARAALEIRRLGAAVCDLMDRRLLTLARETDDRYAQLLPRGAEAMLLTSIEGWSAEEVRDKTLKVVDRIRRRRRLAFEARVALAAEDVALFLQLPKRVAPVLYRLKGSSRPLPFIEDIAIPPESLPDFLVRLQNVLKAHQVTASLFGHAGHGQLHVRPFLDLTNKEDVRRMQDLAEALYQEVLDVGGTISGEHGDGLSRTWYVRRQYGPLYDVFREVKRIFDPQNILNPGKVVAEAPQPLTKNLRSVEVASGSSAEQSADDGDVVGPIQLQLNWTATEMAHTTRACNGCGACRTLSPELRMCPIFRFAPREEASPRAKANLMRAVLTGRLSKEELATDELKSIADLCVNCHQCRLECPAAVDIPKLMIECKGQNVANTGLHVSDWMLTRLEKWAAWGSRFRHLANWVVGSRRLRWVLEKITGIAQGRKLPRYQGASFLRIAARRRLTRPSRRSGRKVLYFVDYYANWHDTQLAEAVVAVLEHNGASVYVHPRQLPSGMNLISLGALDKARRRAARNVSILADAVRQGYHIVASEPSAALCLSHEYPNLMDHDDVRLVAENTSDVCAYLWQMHQVGQLELDLQPINAELGYHLPCHQKALGKGSPGEQLLRLIPGLTVRRIEQGCSGMAGTFGLKRENYRSSLRAGWGLISAMREPMVQVGATECAACKIQMEQGTTKPTIHPVKILALAYGLMPEVASLLTTRGEELVVT